MTSINYQRIWITNQDILNKNGLSEEKIGVACISRNSPDRRWFDVVTGRVAGSNNMDDPVLVAALNEVLPDLHLYRKRVLELIALLPAGHTPECFERLAKIQEGLGSILHRLDQIGTSAAATLARHPMLKYG